jgi:predicted dehydrogenase
LGAGPGAWALHVPTLTRLPDTFRVVHVADGGSGRARDIAGPLGAASSSGHEELLSDPAVEVVAICSPPAEHARHIHAAVDAGKRVIFCEKPLAANATDAEAVIERCRVAGVALLVGTNHLFDPAWSRASHYLTALRGEVRSVSVTVSLPPNDRYHRAVTDDVLLPSSPRPAADLSNPAIAAAVGRALTSGLVVHDIPLLRDLARGEPRLEYARMLTPLGIALGWSVGETIFRTTAVMVPGGADALWRLSVHTDRDRLDIAFPPAFVHAGGASVSVRTADGIRTSYPRLREDGYEAEWRALAALADGDDAVEYDEILADARYGIALADAAAAAIGRAA